MKPILLAALLTLASVTAPSQVRAQDYAALFAEFDPAFLTRDDTRFLQAALAFEGHYKGLLDGDWGRLSQRALTRYAAAQFGTAPESWHMAMLAFAFFDEADKNGWTMQNYDVLDMTFLVPQGAIVNDAPSTNFVNFRHLNSTLAYSIGRHTQKTAQGIHDYTQARHIGSEKPYSVRRDNIAVSTARLSGGGYLYTRSDFRKGLWSTIMIAVSTARDKPLLDAVSSSIAKGYAPPLRLTRKGRLETVILQAIDVLARDKAPEALAAQPAPQPSDPQPESTAAAGSGFVVSPAGHVLTNEHVIAGCSSFSVDGQPAALLAKSAPFDLALLQSASATEKAVAVFSAGPAKLNSDVTVVGYPYGGALGGLNVTRGAVSSLKGLSGDATRLQITAPVQSGNSGGPLVGPSGDVVGVVVSKLDALKMAEAVGDMPQNVNFAVRGEFAKVFLSQNGVTPELSLSEDKLEPTEIAERTAAFTVFVECE